MKPVCEWHEYESDPGGLDFFEELTRNQMYFFVLVQHSIREPSVAARDVVEVIERARPGMSN